MSDLTDADLDNIEAAARGSTHDVLGLLAGFAHPADTLKLVAEVRRLRGMVQGLADRVAAQSELLARRAEGKP